MEIWLQKKMLRYLSLIMACSMEMESLRAFVCTMDVFLSWMNISSDLSIQQKPSYWSYLSDREAMKKAVCDTCRANELENGYVRLVVTRGPGHLG
jgi:hypothetical protein